VRRTIPSLLDQRIDSRLTRDTFRCHILRVEFPAHSFAVNGVGYSGPRVVKTDPKIDFGTAILPRVFRGNDCIVKKDASTGEYIVTQYLTTNNCIPSEVAAVPFQALPTTYPPIGFPPFPPFPLPIGQITPPPQQLNNAYDIGDGLLDTVAASTTQEMLYFTTVRGWSIIGLTTYCTVNLVKLNVFAGRTYAELTVYRDGTGKWTVERYNGSTGALISTWTAAASSNSLSRTLAGADIVSVVGGGAIFRTNIVTDTVGISAFGYGLQGAMA
jgi:hypothetical protein